MTPLLKALGGMAILIGALSLLFGVSWLIGRLLKEEEAPVSLGFSILMTIGGLLGIGALIGAMVWH